jgi:hypothetical protein
VLYYGFVPVDFLRYSFGENIKLMKFVFISDDEQLLEEKRSANSVLKNKYEVSTFPCNGFDYPQKCLHGGKGPLKRKTSSGVFCVCLCSNNWGGAMCSIYGVSGGKARRMLKKSPLSPYSLSHFGR